MAAWALRFPPAETVAVVLMGAWAGVSLNVLWLGWMDGQCENSDAQRHGATGSQKSGAVAVTVISFITKDAAEQGLLSIPCIIGERLCSFSLAEIEEAPFLR